jgi:hypothetical protein
MALLFFYGLYSPFSTVGMINLMTLNTLAQGIGMKHAILSSLMAVMLMMSMTISSAEFNDADIAQFIAQVDDAIQHHDAQAIGHALADNVKITIYVSSQGQSETLHLSKPDYVALLKQNWATYADYRYQRSNMKIQRSHDHATIQAIIHEAITMHGQRISWQSDESVIVKPINGKLLITRVIAKMTL